MCMVMHFNPKTFGLNARIFGTVLGQFGAGILGFFFYSPELKF